MMPQTSRLALTVVLTVASCLTVGCETNGRDSDRVFPTVRAVFDLSEPLHAAESDRPRRFRQGLEVDVTGTAGNFVLDNGVGPTDYTILHGSVAYRFGIEASRVQVHGLAGVGLDRLDLSGNPTARGANSFIGPMIGVEGRVRLRDWVSPYARLTAYLMEEASYTQQFEAGVVFTPHENYEGFLAYRRWDASYGNAAPMGRTLDLEWRGIVLGFGMHF